MTRKDFFKALEYQIEIVGDSKQKSGVTNWAVLTAIGTMVWFGSEHFLELIRDWRLSIVSILLIFSIKGLFDKFLIFQLVGTEAFQTQTVLLSKEDFQPNIWSAVISFRDLGLAIFPVILTSLGVLPAWIWIPAILALLTELLALFAPFTILNPGLIIEIKPEYRAAIKFGVFLSVALALVEVYIYAAAAIVGRDPEHLAFEFRWAGLFSVVLILVEQLAKLASYQGLYEKLVLIRHKLILGLSSIEEAKVDLNKIQNGSDFEMYVGSERERIASIFGKLELALRNLQRVAEAVEKAERKGTFGVGKTEKSIAALEKATIEPVHLVVEIKADLESLKSRLAKMTRFSMAGRTKANSIVIRLTHDLMQAVLRLQKVNEMQKKLAHNLNVTKNPSMLEETGII